MVSGQEKKTPGGPSNFSSAQFLLFGNAYFACCGQAISCIPALTPERSLKYLKTSRTLFMSSCVFFISILPLFMQPYMVSNTHSLKIFYPIVVRDFILMMYNFSLLKSASEMFFHNKTVYCNACPFTFPHNLSKKMSASRVRSLSIIAFNLFKGISITSEAHKVFHAKRFHVVFRGAVFN